MELIQTLLWVSLIVGIVWKYNKPIEAILTAVADRIKSGANIKAGPFEISEQLQPQSLSQQTQKIKNEVSQESKPSESNSKNLNIPNYFEAEDFALRAVQSEYGVALNRQMTAGRDEGFDGAFAKEGSLHLVEVKYVSKSLASKYAFDAANQLVSIVKKYGWQNVRLIIVLVIKEEIQTESIVNSLSTTKNIGTYPVEFKVYTFSELRKMFNIEHN